jgi:amino acid adenylation domain-containing protein
LPRRSEEREIPLAACLHDLVAAQVERTPQAVALVAGHERLTYRDLGRRAGALARRLSALGVGPEVRVGVCLSRSPALVSTLLGVLKAGGAYVPLDPNYPQERLAFMMEDAGAAILVTEQALASRLPPGMARRLVLDQEDGDEPGDASPAVAVEPIRALPGNLAYLIYTSGSTGRPKAVAIEHGSAVALVRWAQATFSAAELAAVLAATSISFDLSIFELFVPLACGGRVVLAQNALELPELPAADEVTLVNTVPSAMAELLRAGALPAAVRTVNLGGEPLRGALAQAVYARGVGRVLNLYGPSEDTTYSTCEEVERGSRCEPTLGRPIAGTRARLLDHDRNPVPAGEPGEIYLGGSGLSRGYFGRPDLTAERFVPDPEASTHGARLYRTGDLGRQLPDGRIEYLGRIDQQVKVRGFRIELGEIEVALAAHPGVREAAVVAREDGLGEKRLVAWLVAAGEDCPSGGELRAFLGAHLPEHMIPAFFLALPALPLTPNGKVDRRQLAGRELPRDGSPGDVTAPRTSTEELLAGIWEGVLGRSRVGIDESFLDLGGDSLLAARVLARLRSALGLYLPPGAVLEALTVAALAEQVDRALAASRSESPQLPPITPRPRDARGEPLSSVQRRLWFLERLLPGTPANNIPVVMRFRGPLLPAVLELALVEIAARHEVLRTAIELGPDGEPRQRVSPPAPFWLPLVDLAALPGARREEERRRLARAEARRPLDPERRGLWRRTLLYSGEAEHDLLITLHHVIADGESFQVLERELAALYGAFLHGRPSPLPALPVQPADVAVWEHQGWTPEALAPHLAYFRERLAGAPAAQALPADLPRPPVRSWRGLSRPLELPPALSSRVRQLARRHGATTYMVLLAAWVALLRRITGQDDVVVGTVHAHRGRPEMEGLIGFFANTLPLRVERPGDPTFGDLLATVRAEALALYAHQELPLEPLAEALRPGRATSAEPLFQVFFAHHGKSGRRELAPGLTFSWSEEDHGAAQFDLFLDLEERGEEIDGRVVASADLFLPATVVRLALGWTALLTDAVARPEAPLSTLESLDAAARHALLVEWSQAPRPPAWHGSVPARIAAWAAAAPGAVALLPAEPGLPAFTYGELVARARRLAGRLRARGVGPDVWVGVYAERTAETLVGMLAVQLAGGAFLPLDPAYPAERLALILDDARVPVLLARPGLAATLPTGDAELVPLDDGSELAAGVDLEAGPELGAGVGFDVEPDVDPDVDPDQIAYVIYTSGSTGRPKGVLLPHGGFVGAVEALAERSGVDPESRVLQFASAGFDASVWEIWSTLIRGATLVFARGEDLLPGPALLATLRRRGITNVFLTPTALAALPEGASRELSDLRGLVVGGEAFPPDLVARWAPGRRLWNAYGPTEASICVSMARLGTDGQTPIGRPVARHRLLVLGHHLELLPPGVPGELYVGGPALARGYLGKPDLTARAFVPDPTAEEIGARNLSGGAPGARLYRTGDLARFRPDGQLEFLGRADRQVKVRGFRIEPGEVEAQIVEHPGVREAVVVPYAAGPQDLRLAAYVVGAAAAAPTVAELRAFLRARLPEHMVPAAVRFLPSLPLSPGGKVDRRALPPPVADEPAPAGAARALGTPSEELLAGIWGELLGREEIGAGDDFFDLGGHSLLIGQLLARVRATFGVDLRVRAAFEAHTLAAQARRIDEARQAGGSGPEPLPLVRVARDRPLPLSFGQERLWFLYRLDPGSAVYNLALPFRLRGPLDPALLERSLDEVFRRHEALRTTFAERPGGELCQVVAPARSTALPRVDLAGLPPPVAAAEADRLTAREVLRPFDLVRGPVARALLLRLGARQHQLLFCCHHVAFDGWSVGVLRRELGALYGAFRAGRPSPLPELPFQYADHAVWQRRWLSGEALETQLAYWRERLAGAPAALELPADRPRPLVQSFRGAQRPLAFPAELAAGLRALSRGEGATLFMTALAALLALLGRFTGKTDLVVGSPVANRRQPESEELLGFFVNALALRADLAGDPPFRALAAQVRDSALSAYAHQDLPFERLVEELQPVRDLSRTPLFQVVFALDPVRDGELAPGLGCELLRVDSGTAKFDLTLFLIESEGGLTGLLEYATDLFDAPTVLRLGRSLVAMLSGLVAEGAGLPLSRLPLLAPGERWQIRAEWDGPPLPALPDACMHELVAEQVERTPEATALVAGRERITYRELARRAAAVARRLAARGVGPEVRVAVCLSRTPAMVATLLGVLEAGGAYVPLDPAYPRERLGFMLEDADASLIVTEAAVADRLPPSPVPVLMLDANDADDAEGDEESAGRPPGAARARALPANLAYLIYTSGSTGRPKAVAIEHRNAVAFLRWAHQEFGPEELASVNASTSICFDISIYEMFGPLTTGGQMILAADALELPELPAAGEITMLNTVPSATAELLRAGLVPAGVRWSNLAGEPLKGSLAQAVFALGIEKVRNFYGPSEDTTYSTFERVERGSRREPTVGRPVSGSWARVLDPEMRLVPVGVVGEIWVGGAGLSRGYLGRPALTAERWVPDPLGGVGSYDDLHGGPGARMDSHGGPGSRTDSHGGPGARLYRTGDLGRYLPDGRLDCLGRIDNQVKVRGFRIELGEIELALAAHPGVHEAVVVARGEPGVDRSLAAYFVPAGEALAAADLRDYLRGRLADFMVPASFTCLAELPRTANGKVDRKALPAPESGAAETFGGAFGGASGGWSGRAALGRGPVDPLVELVAGIWAEVLESAELPGPGDDFFELGGHSLLAIRVVSRVRAALGIELPLRALFAAPTVSALAAAIAAAISARGGEANAAEGALPAAPPAPPILPRVDHSDLPLSFAQQRLWLLDRLEPGAAVYNLPSPRAIRGPLDAAVLERALREVVSRHEVLRTSFAVDAASGEPRPVVAPPGGFSLPRVDLSALPEPARTAEAERLTDEDAEGPFDLSTGPLFRARLLILDGQGAGEDWLSFSGRRIALRAEPDSPGRRRQDKHGFGLTRSGSVLERPRRHLDETEPARGPEHHLLLNMHHICGDGWSLDLLLAELSALYRAYAAGLPSPLPELAIQYSDFAAWQRRWLDESVLAAQLAYWREQLAAAPEALDLPTDRPRPPAETSRGAHFLMSLPRRLTAAVRTLSRRQGATLFMVLFSGFAALLQRLTGAADILAGTPIAGRGRGEIEGLIGFFVNTLVLRADLSGAPSFGTLIARVRETALAAYAHQDLPFERLVEELQPQRSLARSPLFQVSFVLGVEESVGELAPGLPLSPLPVETGTSKFDLTLGLDLRGDDLIADVEYRTDLFDRATVMRWAGSFVELLGAAVAAPERPLWQLDPLSAAERHQLMREWNDTSPVQAAPVQALPAPPAPLSQDVCLHQLFAAQAARTPEAVALVAPDGRQRLTYRELAGRAEALARRLRARGIGPEVLAGVLVERSVELVVALLAVLKAGGAYVPIDPNYPRQRVAQLLSTSRAAVLVTRRSLLRDLGLDVPPATVPLLLDEPEKDAAPEPLSRHPVASNLAYVIFTSGSTGEPKGVAIEHRSAVAFARWARQAYSDAERAGVLGATSVCFDVSILEIFVTLAWGGKILLAENALALPALPARDEVTMVCAVPSAVTELVRSDRLPDSVRTVNLGGEAVKGSLPRRVYEASRARRVTNDWGPTEDTTYSAISEIPRDVDTPAVGRPVHGTRAYLLDGELQPVPIGVPGAVYLAGDGLSRGYLGRPALTAERFLPDPYGAPGARLYFVGDLARYRTDGEIEYLGRLDHQVKLRGFRVELEEIEAVVLAHPAVERAVVATHAYGPEDVRLVAWVVPQPSEELETEALLAWVGKRLPDYMVPSAVVVLAALPLTPNGKVDRLSLPAPAAAAPRQAEAPRSPLEELVAGVWSEILGCGQVGLEDHFFALGGYSLLAIRMLARLRAATGVDLPLRALFAHPTVAALAAEIERSLRAPGAPPLPPVEPSGVVESGAGGDRGEGGDAPAASAQARLWFFHQLDPGGAVLNVPHPLRLSGPLQPAVLAATLAAIARRHAALRTSFSYGAEGLRQRIAPVASDLILPLPLADLSALPPPLRAAEARRLTESEAREPFDLAAPPLWRARLLRLEEEEHRLLLTFHHIVVDGWSVELFERDLAALYPACLAAGGAGIADRTGVGGRSAPAAIAEPAEIAHAAGVAAPSAPSEITAPAGSSKPTAGTPSAAPPALQYADYVAWQRRWLTDEHLAPQLAYWRRQLAGLPPPLDLPADRPRPARQTFRGAALALPLPAALAAQVRELGQREGCTLFMTVFAAFAALVSRYTGRTDVVLGSPAANRHTPGTEGLIGFFVGILVLRLDLAGDPTFRELLGRARAVALGAYANQDVPFERLVEELDLARDKSRSSLVQVMLSVQRAGGEPLRFAGLAAELVEAHTATSQFDFTLGVLDLPQGLTLQAELNTDLFDPATVERLLAHLALLLGAVAADPDLRLSALPAEIAPRPASAAAAAESLPGAKAAEEDNREPVDPAGLAETDLARRQAQLAARRSGLAAAERELLEARLRRKR